MDAKYIKEIEERIVLRLQMEFPDSIDLVKEIIEDHFGNLLESYASSTSLPSEDPTQISDEEIEKKFPTDITKVNLLESEGNSKRQEGAKWAISKAREPKEEKVYCKCGGLAFGKPDKGERICECVTV